MKIEQKKNARWTFLSSLFFFSLRVCVAVMFIVAGLAKVYDPGRFLNQIMAFDMTPYWMGYSIAHFLPMLEIVCGIMLLSFSCSCAAAVLLMLLELGFVAFLLHAHGTGLALDCGCFGNWFMIGSFKLHMALNLAVILILVSHFIRTLRLQALMESKNK